MIKIDDGGPAFPRTDVDEKGRMAFHPGMSIRAWLAGQALAGIHAAYESEDWPHECVDQGAWYRNAAECAVRSADALIAKLAEGGAA